LRVYLLARFIREDSPDPGQIVTDSHARASMLNYPGCRAQGFGFRVHLLARASRFSHLGCRVQGYQVRLPRIFVGTATNLQSNFRVSGPARVQHPRAERVSRESVERECRERVSREREGESGPARSGSRAGSGRARPAPPRPPPPPPTCSRLQLFDFVWILSGFI
jgi:hypothetical protein